MILNIEEIRARYPQTRGMDDVTLLARGEDMIAALRARYHVTRTDEDAERALAAAARAHFGWWLLYQDQIASESASTTGASTTHGAPAWPAGLAPMLARVADEGANTIRLARC